MSGSVLSSGIRTPMSPALRSRRPTSSRRRSRRISPLAPLPSSVAALPRLRLPPLPPSPPFLAGVSRPLRLALRPFERPPFPRPPSPREVEVSVSSMVSLVSPTSTVSSYDQLGERQRGTAGSGAVLWEGGCDHAGRIGRLP